MFELHDFITDIIGSAPDLRCICIFSFLRSVLEEELKQKNMLNYCPLIKSTLIFLAGVGTVFGLGLALTAKRFSVQDRPAGRESAGCACTRTLRRMRVRRLRTVCRGSGHKT